MFCRIRSIQAIFPCVMLSCAILFFSRTARADQKAASAEFENSFAKIVIRNCLGCHNGSDAKGGLDLSRKESLIQGGESGLAIVPGKPGESYLIERIRDGSMPPAESGSTLSKEDIAHLTDWVKQGAVWPSARILSPFETTTDSRAGFDWWSLRPLLRPPLPATRQSSWIQNPIDAFVIHKHKEHDITPAGEADRATYLRRAKYDLLGLPPDPAEINQFIHDHSPDARAKLVDRLLASPHYGERWGRHWLDVVRYGESDGFEHDKYRPHAWRYRDYVVESFNNDKPYSQFVIEQLAGDVREPVTRDGIIATGFLVAGSWDEVQNVGASQPEMMRAHEEQMEELIGSVSQTFLGMTVHCGRCHDHKFDPVPQKDYYRLKAVFDGVDHGNRSILTPAEEQTRQAAIAPIQHHIDQLKADLAKLDSLKPGNARVIGLPAEAISPTGRFSGALDARKVTAQTEMKPAYQTPPVTVECWAKIWDHNQFNVLVANQPKASSDHWEIYTYSGSGVFSAFLPGYLPSEIKSDVKITDGRWHYLAMQFDGKRLRLFVDAKLVKDAAVKRNRQGGPTGPLTFGGYPLQGIGCDGLLEEVRISNTIRPIDTVPSGPFVTDPRTIGLWHFDQLQNDRFRDHAVSGNEPDHDELQRRKAVISHSIKQFEKKLQTHAAPVSYSGKRLQPKPTHLLLRGDMKSPGDEVTAGGLSSIPVPSSDFGLEADAPEGQRRIRFAEWVADPRHPLTARVMVNRIWHYHFGQGLVKSPSDLGFHGGSPSHPELLDWLAAELIESGWSLKHLHKLIMLSATYQQSSDFNQQGAAFDSENRLLWRFTPRRLEAEIVRDAMLAVSGNLNDRVGGASYRPFTVTVFNTHFYHLFDKGTPEFNRRTVYRANVNTGRSPFLDAFDCPAPSIAAPKRRNTTTPLQALALMNNSFMLRQADRFARRLQESAGNDRNRQISLGYLLTFGREPTDKELATTVQFVSDNDLQSLCWVLLNSSEFLYVR